MMNSHRTAGLLVAFCGIDGSGKSTQIRLTEDYLAGRQIPSVSFKQPTPFYRKNTHVRKKLDENMDSSSVEFLALLSAADRVLQQKHEVEPALAEGKVVLMDRYVYSAFAYMYARGIQDVPWLEAINKFVRKPDITFYFDVDPEQALQRIILRDGRSTKKEEQRIEVMRVVRAQFLKMVETHGLIPIDGAKPLEDIHQKIARNLDPLLKIRL